MLLPNLLVIGAPKCGTTALCHYLAASPDFFVPRRKEVGYFTRFWHLGVEWYGGHFEQAENEQIICDGTVQMSLGSIFPDAFERAAKTIPEARLVYMIRHPLERIESMYLQLVASGEQVPEFNTAVREWRPLVDGCCYDREYERITKWFPADRIHVILFDDFKAATAGCMVDLATFLGLESDPFRQGDYSPRNQRSALRRNPNFVSNLRHSSFGNFLRRAVPEEAKAAVRKRIEQKVELDVCRWDRATLEWVCNHLREDSTSILKKLNRPATTWSLDVDEIERRLGSSTSESFSRTALEGGFVYMRQVEPRSETIGPPAYADTSIYRDT